VSTCRVVFGHCSLGLAKLGRMLFVSDVSHLLLRSLNHNVEDIVACAKLSSSATTLPS
jgi:hypothetical protein